ncbi:MAG: hypothetical protein ACK5T0_04585 [Vampirovibrionales bacterium]
MPNLVQRAVNVFKPLPVSITKNLETHNLEKQYLKEEAEIKTHALEAVKLVEDSFNKIKPSDMPLVGHHLEEAGVTKDQITDFVDRKKPHLFLSQLKGGLGGFLALTASLGVMSGNLSNPKAWMPLTALFGGGVALVKSSLKDERNIEKLNYLEKQFEKK